MRKPEEIQADLVMAQERIEALQLELSAAQDLQKFDVTDLRGVKIRFTRMLSGDVGVSYLSDGTGTWVQFTGFGAAEACDISDWVKRSDPAAAG